MRSRTFLLLIFSAMTAMSGCFNTNLVAPSGGTANILGHDVPVDFHKEYKNWYLFGGLLPIYTVQPDVIIKKENLVEVRVQTEDTLSDGIITVLTAVLALGLFPQTVVVEGHSAKDVNTP